jgi:hypothetical protein
MVHTVGCHHGTAHEEHTMDANTYTLAIAPEVASRFLLIAGIGMPARRETCLLELQLHVIRVFGEERAEKINRTLYNLVCDYEGWLDATGAPMRRCATV